MRILAAFGLTILLGITACSRGPVSPVVPAQSTGLPFGVNDDEVETPNSLPGGFTTNHPMAPDTGVIGVTTVPSGVP